MTHRALRILVPAVVVSLVFVAGCAEARRCREIRREARWAVSSYLESLRPAVAQLAERKRALEAAVSDGAAVVPEGGEDPRAELAQVSSALPAWTERMDAVSRTLDSLNGTGPVPGDPLGTFTDRDDEVNPQAFRASREAIEKAIEACGTK